MGVLWCEVLASECTSWWLSTSGHVASLLENDRESNHHASSPSEGRRRGSGGSGRPGTQRGSGRVCGIFQRSSGLRDAAQVAFDHKNFSLQTRNSRPSGSRHRLSPSSGQHTVDHTQQPPKFCSGHRVLSAKSLQHRWKHGIQVALLRRRAAITRAVLLHTSARAERLVAGLIDRATSHQVREPPPDGDDEDADAGSDTQHQMTTMTTSHLSPVTKSQPSSSQTCDRCSPLPSPPLSPSGGF